MQRSLWLRTIFLKNEIPVSDEQLMLLERYVELLLGWNKKVNLISRKDEDRVWESHILHSLSILFLVRLPSAATALDLGTGGGLPGIPLKILLPGLKMTFLDSIQKKVGALQDIIDRLSISQAHAVWGRAEKVGTQPKYRGVFDLVLARGVGSLPDLIRYARPFLKSRPEMAQSEARSPINLRVGRPREEISRPALLAFKGGMMDQEIAKANRLKVAKSIRTMDLVFQGSEEVSLLEKKIIVAEF